MIRSSSLPAIAALLLLSSIPVRAADRPNILWLVCEDASVEWFGCYGNPKAHTPNIDALAREGFRYLHAFASAPVCAPSRSGWITGINAISTGTLPMRSRYLIPHDLIKYYPDYLRQAGYYAANHTKTDYNIGGRPDDECWDSKSPRGWQQRKPDQPFFQVINFNESHESKAQGDVTETNHSPGDVTLRKYHPDETGIRQTYAKYYDAVEAMDIEVGKQLQALEDSGLAADTIVIFNSDHGGVMPRSKRFLFDSGTHCPLIIRIPEKWKALWPAAAPGATVDRLVSFLDMPKTWLSLASAEVPPVMQGRIFLGPDTEPEPPFVFSFRERMDERIDNMRAVRDKRFVYIKNYMPFVIWGQHLDYLWKMAATQAWEDAFKQHRTDEVTGRFFTTKPVEELYDMDADPDNVVNLADKPEHQQTLVRMRTALREWQLQIHDTAMMPEAERVRRATDNKTTVYEMARNPKLYNLPAYLDTADLALAKAPANRAKLVELLRSEDSGIRYWAITGLLMLEEEDAPEQTALESALGDQCSEVRALAAWALLRTGKTDRATPSLVDLLKNRTPATLMVLNVIDWAHLEFDSLIEPVSSIKNLDPNATRLAAWLFESHGKPVPKSMRNASDAEGASILKKDR